MLRSLGEDKNNQPFRPSLTNPKTVVPDYVHSVRLRVKNSPNVKDDDVFDFPNAAFVDQNLITYATEKNVLLFQRTTQQDVSNPNRIRVGPLVMQLNTTQNRKTGENTYPVAGNLNCPGQSVQINYEVR